jgi:hypothetical protein
MRLLLETVQYINGPTEANGIDGAVRVPVVVLDNLQYSGPCPFPRLRRGVFAAKLSMLSAVPIPSLTASGNAIKSRFVEPTQYKGRSLRAGGRIGCPSQF